MLNSDLIQDLVHAQPVAPLCCVRYMPMLRRVNPSRYLKFAKFCYWRLPRPRLSWYSIKDGMDE